MENMEIWNKVKQPPKEALKQITGVRGMSGMTDIKPQWRYQIMTEVFGPCGTGWKFDIVRLWSEDGADGVKFAFAQINLYCLNPENNSWHDPIPGIGGNVLVRKETNGLYSSDEGYKMAITDALSTATKMLGVAADIYAGKWDGSKYADAKEAPQEKPSEPMMTTDQKTQLSDALIDAGLEITNANKKKLSKKYGITQNTTAKEADVIIQKIIEDFAAGEML